jgi:hypothetical protein
MERSGMREPPRYTEGITPDCATLYPGYLLFLARSDCRSFLLSSMDFDGGLKFRECHLSLLKGSFSAH